MRESGDENFERAARAGRQARQRGASAVETAKAMIAAGFDAAAAHIDLKAKVAAVLANGTADPANRLRYGARVRMLRGKSLKAAIATVERWHQAERQAFQIAAIMGHPPTLSLTVLRELRLILRFFRRKRMGNGFPALIEALCERARPAQFAAAAE
jgi:hypothetical protein